MRLVTFAEENPNGKLIFGAAVAVVAEYWKTIKGLGGTLYRMEGNNERTAPRCNKWT